MSPPSQIRALVERARRRGELRPGTSAEVAGAMIGGPLLMWYVILLTKARVTLPTKLEDDLTDAILRGIAATSRTGAPRTGRTHEVARSSSCSP